MRTLWGLLEMPWDQRRIRILPGLQEIPLDQRRMKILRDLPESSWNPGNMKISMRTERKKLVGRIAGSERILLNK